MVPVVICQDANHQAGVVILQWLVQAQTSQIDFDYRTVVVITSGGADFNRPTTIYINQVPQSSCLTCQIFGQFFDTQWLTPFHLDRTDRTMVPSDLSLSSNRPYRSDRKSVV